MQDNWNQADAYERYMGRWSRPLAGAFLEWLVPPQAARWLEVGCGTGALTAAICERCAPASVVACDPSEPFVEHARASVRAAAVQFVVAGADALPGGPDAYDVAVSGLALNLVAQPAAALAGMRVRLRSGGLLAAYVWDYGGGMEFLRRFWDEAGALDAAAVDLDEARRFPLCRPGTLRAVLADAGLRGVEVDVVEIPTRFRDFEDYWQPFLGATGPAPSYVASLTDEGRQRLRDQLQRSLATDADGTIPLVARAWAARGTAT